MRRCWARGFEELHKNRAEDRLGHTMLLTDGETEDADQLMKYLEAFFKPLFSNF